MATNNGAEDYHGRLKSLIKCRKLMEFLDTLNEIILDTNIDFARLTGLHSREKEEEKCAKRPAVTEISVYLQGRYTILEYVKAISHGGFFDRNK